MVVVCSGFMNMRTTTAFLMKHVTTTRPRTKVAALLTNVGHVSHLDLVMSSRTTHDGKSPNMVCTFPFIMVHGMDKILVNGMCFWTSVLFGVLGNG